MMGTLAITIDFELAWGVLDVRPDDPDLLTAARWTNRSGVPQLMALFEATGISATWAIVGALARDGLGPVDHFTEVELDHFPYPWFHFVPKQGGEAEAPEWFAPSLVRDIVAMQPRQEVGFHSYSHVLFNHPGTPRDRLVEELEECLAVAEDLGVSPESFVFPRNGIGHLDLISKAGFRSYRSLDQMRFDAQERPRPIRKAVAYGSDLLSLTPALIVPRVEEELVELPGSLMIRHAERSGALVPDRNRSRRLHQGLASAVRDGGIFHVWFHPINMYAGGHRLLRVIESFLLEAQSLIESGVLRNATMADLAAEAADRS